MTRAAVHAVARRLGAVRGAPAAETGHAPPPSDEAGLRAWLVGQIADLLLTRPALLLSHLYRVDVREADVQAALAAADPAAALADALIAREAEKARYRARYRPSPPADNAPADDAAL